MRLVDIFGDDRRPGNRRKTLGDQHRRGSRRIERQERLAPLPDPFLHQAQIEAILAEHEADEARMWAERVVIQRVHGALGSVVALKKPSTFVAWTCVT